PRELPDETLPPVEPQMTLQHRPQEEWHADVGGQCVTDLLTGQPDPRVHAGGDRGLIAGGEDVLGVVAERGRVPVVRRVPGPFLFLVLTGGEERVEAVA